jgi:hypothetical protein
MSGGEDGMTGDDGMADDEKMGTAMRKTGMTAR